MNIPKHLALLQPDNSADLAKTSKYKDLKKYQF